MREMLYGVNGRKDSAKRLHVQVVFGSSSRASRESIDKGKGLVGSRAPGLVVCC